MFNFSENGWLADWLADGVKNGAKPPDDRMFLSRQTDLQLKQAPKISTN